MPVETRGAIVDREAWIGVDHVKTFHTHRKVQLDAYIGNTWYFYELLSPVRDARSTIVKFVIFIVSIY